MAIGVDGAITVGRIQTAINPPSLALTRLLPSGTPDAAFGNQGDQHPGLRIFDLSRFGTASYYEYRGGFASTPDGGFYLAGTLYFSSGVYGSVILKIRANGTLDESFGSDGVVVEKSGVTSIAVTDDARLVVAGRQSSFQQPFLVRLLPNGQRDPAFAGGGVVFLDAANTGGVALDTPQLLITPQGDYLVVADSISIPPSPRKAALLRVTRAGVRDTEFANGRGIALTGTFRRLYHYGKSASILPDGTIVTAGSGNSGCTVTRWTADGTKYEAFGNAGSVVLTVEVPFFFGDPAPSECSDITSWEDGRLYVLGSAIEIEGGIRLEANFVAALHPTRGDLDPGYGQNGFGWPVYRPSSYADISAIDRLNRVTIAGSQYGYPFYAARLTADSIYSDDFEADAPRSSVR